MSADVIFVSLDTLREENQSMDSWRPVLSSLSMPLLKSVRTWAPESGSTSLMRAWFWRACLRVRILEFAF